jgi:thioredoxin-like negative regulator of GroEL
MAPRFAEAARQRKGRAVFLKMNADQCQTPARLGVQGIPALYMFENGKVIAQKAGLMSESALLQWIDAA